MDADVAAPTIEMKKHTVFNKLAKRNDARMQARGDSIRTATLAAANEFSDAFSDLRSRFLAVCDSIRIQTAVSKEVDPEKVEEASGILQDLQRLLNGRVAGLPPFRVQQMQSELDKYYAEVTRLREENLPKKKFGFRKGTEAGAKPKQASPPTQKKIDVVATDFTNQSEVNVANLTSEVRELTAEEVVGKDVSLRNLSDCVIRITGSPATVHATNVKNCEIYTGPVKTSIFLDSCSGSKFNVACQQLRIHSTSDCRFFTYVASRAIIEDCSSLAFAPYSWSYPGFDEDFSSCGFSFEKNNWRSVDDFNWLALDRPSPNFTFLSEETPREKMP